VITRVLLLLMMMIIIIIIIYMFQRGNIKTGPPKYVAGE